MNIALVSCDNLPGWEVDDQPLIDALDAKGATVHRYTIISAGLFSVSNSKKLPKVW